MLKKSQGKMMSIIMTIFGRTYGGYIYRIKEKKRKEINKKCLESGRRQRINMESESMLEGRGESVNK